VIKPGVTQELRARVNAHLAAESRQRRLTTTAVVIALVAAGVFLLARWLL
jgi:hypothetical protein